jgi:hypothetical protein
MASAMPRSVVSQLDCDCIDRKSDTCAPRRCCNFRDEDENPDVEAVPIKKGALALAEESGISGYYLHLLILTSEFLSR